MKKIIIAVGSKRGPKLNAVTEALGSFSAALAHDAEFEVVGVEVESGVSHTPASRDELMRGARQRAEALVEMARASGAAWQYFVGLEGGLDVVPGIAASSWKAGPTSPTALKGITAAREASSCRKRWLTKFSKMAWSLP